MSSSSFTLDQPLKESTTQQVDQLYRSHHGWLMGWLISQVRCSDQAADLAQDTFVRIMLRTELENIKNPRALLTTVARGLAVDQWRRSALEKAYLSALMTLPEPSTPSAEEQQIMLELLNNIVQMLEKLKPKVATAFLLSQVEGMTQQNIADQLQLSKRTVQRYIGEALFHCYQLRYGGGDERS